MYAAITTKYLGPTNHRGSRIKANSQAGSITLPRDYSLNVSDNHAKAARALAEKLGWSGEWHGGATANDAGYTFVIGLKAGPLFSVEAAD